MKISHVYILQICRLAAACGGIKPAVCLGQTPVMQHSAACSRHSGLQRCTAGKFGLTWTQPSHAALCSTAGHVSLSSLYLPFTHRSCVRRSKFCCLMLFFNFEGICHVCQMCCIVLFKRIFGLFVTNLVLFSQISKCVKVKVKG